MFTSRTVRHHWNKGCLFHWGWQTAPQNTGQLGSSVFSISLLTSPQLLHRHPLMTLFAVNHTIRQPVPIKFEHNLIYKHSLSPFNSSKQECNHRGLLTAHQLTHTPPAGVPGTGYMQLASLRPAMAGGGGKAYHSSLENKSLAFT